MSTMTTCIFCGFQIRTEDDANTWIDSVGGDVCASRTCSNLGEADHPHLPDDPEMIEHLQTLVRDVASQLASSANNSGEEINFLTGIGGWTHVQIANALKEEA